MPEPIALVTPRLELVPCSLCVADALGDDLEEGGRLLNARVPTEWPDPELAEFLPLYANLLRQDPLKGAKTPVQRGIRILTPFRRGRTKPRSPTIFSRRSSSASPLRPRRSTRAMTPSPSTMPASGTGCSR
jgi:hypothetical protein